MGSEPESYQVHISSFFINERQLVAQHTIVSVLIEWVVSSSIIAKMLGLLCRQQLIKYEQLNRPETVYKSGRYFGHGQWKKLTITFPLSRLLFISTADFSDGFPLITYVQVTLDTNTLLSSMVEQARLVVFKAVARATALPSSNVFNSKRSTEPAPLSQFNSSLSLVQAEQLSVSERKAHASAQRLSDLLHGRKIEGTQRGAKDDQGNHHQEEHTLGKSRKNRSVTWNSPVEEPKSDSSNLPVAKRRKLMPQEPSMTRSNKSFGRPELGVFESVRNATFAEFGHMHTHSNVPNFVNGRLQVSNAHHQPSRVAMAGFGEMSQSNANFRNARRTAQSMVNLQHNSNSRFATSGNGMSLSRSNLFGLSRRPAASQVGAERRPCSNEDLSRNTERRQSPASSSKVSLPQTPTELEFSLLSHTGGNQGGNGRQEKDNGSNIQW